MEESHYDRLEKYLRETGGVAVAFSGGVDSAFLLYAAKEALGERALAVTAALASIPERELIEAKAFCESYRIRQIMVYPDQLAFPEFVKNPPERCYHCKRAIFTHLIEAAAKEGIDTVVDGSNLDDNTDYRPGLKALSELKVKSPLAELGFGKKEIRALSRKFGLPTWNKQSFACLASRIPYGDAITEETLKRIDGAEQFLLDRGYGQLRVRAHGDIARIELETEDFARFMEKDREETERTFRGLGFAYVTLDLRGYRTGSLNEIISVNNEEDVASHLGKGV